MDHIDTCILADVSSAVDRLKTCQTSQQLSWLSQCHYYIHVSQCHTIHTVVFRFQSLAAFYSNVTSLYLCIVEIHSMHWQENSDSAALWYVTANHFEMAFRCVKWHILCWYCVRYLNISFASSWCKLSFAWCWKPFHIKAGAWPVLWSKYLWNQNTRSHVTHAAKPTSDVVI